MKFTEENKKMHINTTAQKEKFLRYTYAVESISAALKTRNKNWPVYEPKCSEKEKEKFKKMLLNRIMDLWKNKTKLTKEVMFDEIKSLKNDFEQQFSSIFYEGKFRIGVCQKLICLYAKYLWVSGQLKIPPPLIPYDGIVKGLLKDKDLQDWTVLNDMDEYEKIIKKINEESKNHPAEWELENWNKKTQG